MLRWIEGHVLIRGSTYSTSTLRGWCLHTSGMYTGIPTYWYTVLKVELMLTSQHTYHQHIVKPSHAERALLDDDI